MFFPVPILITLFALTSLDKTNSTVVGETSGKILQISDFEMGKTLFNTVASILDCLLTFPLLTVANLLSNSL